ncbi:MAG: eCIS core domain-containing protein [Acidimicrobiales bacterium]
MAPRHWAALPTLPPTVTRAPKVGQADQFVAALAGTQPLVHPPTLIDRSKDGPAGLVRGMATARIVEVSEVPSADTLDTSGGVGEPVAPLETAAPHPPVDSPRRLRVSTAPPPEPETLTRFTDDPGPLIHATPPAPPVPVALPVASEPPGGAADEADAVAEARAGEAEGRAAPTTRLNLGQSRRFGLGAPVSRPADEPFSPAALTHPPPPRPQVSEPPGSERIGAEPHDGDAGPPIRVGPAPAPDTPAEPARQAPRPPATGAPRAAPQSPGGTANAAYPVAEGRAGEAESREAQEEAALPLYRPAPSAPPEPLPAEPRSLRLEPVPARRRVEQVPHEVAGAFQATHGISVRDVPIHRGPEVSDAARSLGAIAYERGGQVFLPDEAGPLDRPETRGLLAHELTHVVHRQMLGGLPGDGSTGAEILEADAQDAERFFRGDGGAPEPRPVTQTLVHPPKSTVGMLDADSYADQIADELVTRGIARRAWDGTLTFGPPSELIEAQVSEAVQRATALAPSGPPAGALASGAGGGGGGLSWTSAGGFLKDIAVSAVASDIGNLFGVSVNQRQEQHAATQQQRTNLQQERDDRYTRLLQEENERRAAAGETPLDFTRDADRIRQLREQADSETNFSERSQRLATTPPASTTGGGAGGLEAAAGGAAAIGALASSGGGAHAPTAEEHAAPGHQDGAPPSQNRAQSGRPEVTPDDVHLDALARRLWEYIRTHMRGELLVDRERAGKLSDATR